MSSKLTLCMIVKPDAKEAVLLDRALGFVSPYVDEICITQAGSEPSKEVSEVVKKYNGKESFFKWVHDFSKARNYNFSQATGDYIFWIDSDDVVKGAENLRSVIEKMDEDKLDAVVMDYLYDFYKTKDKSVCTVKHLKTRIVKKGVVEWVGEIHEDFAPLRSLSPNFCKEIEILHVTDNERAKESSARNIEIARIFCENKPEDARGPWLMANAYQGENQIKKAVEYYRKFVEVSNSEEEKFIAYLRIGDLDNDLDGYLKALSLRPDYPDAYLRIGEFYYATQKYELAKRFIIFGLRQRVPEQEIIVYNPRDYDFNPILTLAKTYFELKEFKNAMLCLERCEKIIPSHPQSSEMLGMMKKLKTQEDIIDEIAKKVENEKDVKKAKRILEKAPESVRSHPKFCALRNLFFIKTESTGKDIAYYCSYTDEEWYPGAPKVGGSEEAVINLAKEWTKAGYNVTVFNRCGNHAKIYEGVQYRPYWEYNPRDKYDALILWRHPRPADFKHGTKKIYVDVHDVIGTGEFTQDRLEKIEKIFFKTRAHRENYPNIPDEKVAIVPNGIDPSQFPDRVSRNPYLILNTSSPDRHLDATLDIFEELIKRQPEKPWKLAWYYGWHNYLAWNRDNKELMEFYDKQSKRFDKLVKEGKAEGGTMLPQAEIAKKYLEAGIFLYPTQFFEIHCISAVKAQAAGCYPITSDAFALDESIQYGTKVHTDHPKWGTSNTFGDSENLEKYLEAILTPWDEKMMEISGEREWAVENYNWKKISIRWISEFDL